MSPCVEKHINMCLIAQRDKSEMAIVYSCDSLIRISHQILAPNETEDGDFIVLVEDS